MRIPKSVYISAVVAATAIPAFAVDRFTVFADKLSVTTSLCFANGGLIVIEGWRTLFLKDTNGDNVADERHVLFDGWGTRDAHATASNPDFIAKESMNNLKRFFQS